MDRRRLEAFTRIVDMGSFRNVAIDMKTSPPALSQLIARLEAEVGIKLIDRSTRPLTVTQAGKEFYIRAHKVLESMAALDELVSDSHDARIGKVRVGLVPAMQFSSPARAVRSFREKHPDVEVELDRFATTDLLEALDQGRVDVAILLTEPTLKGVQSRPLYSEEYVVCLPAGHPLTQKSQVGFRDLEHERLIHGNRSGNPTGHDAIIAACVSAGFSAHYVAAQGSFLDHAAMVSAGMGVSFSPASFQHLRPNGVEYRELVEPSVGMTVTVSWFESRVDAAGRAFVQHCIDRCTGP